ncbi:MAG: hypothetical protein ACYTHJ_18620 [Planctomycetota bacterium]|jgi:hypothetical protein
MKPDSTSSKDQNSPPQQESSLKGVLAIWLIFAPTALLAAVALIVWFSINFTRLNAIYAVLLALFFAGIFFFLVFGVFRRYMQERKRHK